MTRALLLALVLAGCQPEPPRQGTPTSLQPRPSLREEPLEGDRP